MNGIYLSKKYYEAYSDILWSNFPTLRNYAAAGLVGEGSQCFGFDDEISRDHDFGPGFCIWLTEEDYAAYGNALQDAYNNLPDRFLGISSSLETAADRVGVFSTGEFYRKFLGTDKYPLTNEDWFFLTENNLATCTNGVIFEDNLGAFSEFRHHLLKFYPEDIQRKKIAARAAVMAQAGQYNFPRLLKRGDITASLLALSRFIEAALSMIYLLNRHYMPFYKWAFYGTSKLTSLQELRPMLQQLASQPISQASVSLIERICVTICRSLNSEGFSNSRSSFLQDHLSDIMSGINDPEFAAMHPMADFTY